MSAFTHLDQEGRVRMVDVTEKKQTGRVATAQGIISMDPNTFEMIRHQTVKKGNVLETARIAWIMAAKKTSDLIPMCHPLNVTHVQVDFFPMRFPILFGLRPRRASSAKQGLKWKLSPLCLWRH